jgi:hypothetical protein
MKRIDFDSAAKRARQEANGAEARAKQAESKASSAKTKVRMAKSALKQAKKTLKAARKDAKAAKKELANWREAAAQKEQVAMKAEKKAIKAHRSIKAQKGRTRTTPKSGARKPAPFATVSRARSPVKTAIPSARPRSGPLPNPGLPVTTALAVTGAIQSPAGGSLSPDAPG